MFELLREVVDSIRAHKLRFALTSLGVTWGALMLTVLSAQMGNMGAHFRREMEEIGPKLVIMGRGQIAHERVGERMSRELDLEPEHIERIEALELVEHASPSVEIFNSVVRGTRTRLLEVVGVDWDADRVRNIAIARGRFLSASDIERNARVAVLGPEAERRLFGSARAIGESLLIAGTRFRVIGVTTDKGTQLANIGNPDDQIVLIPYTTAQRWFTQSDDVREFTLAPPTREQSAEAIEAVRGLIGLHERFAPDADTAMWSMNWYDTTRTIFAMLSALQLFFLVAGTVTLFVGAVGVMNMMLVVVGERTWEIGLRKALGARSRDVFAQFLLEGVIVSGGAGLLGTALGIAALRALRVAFQRGGIETSAWPDPVTTAAVSGSLVLVAIVAGLTPALRAARVSPAEALRAY
jgi:putative ABC transport system permease protein